MPKDKYVASLAPVRLDALENYVRGILAATAEEKVQHYRDAARLNPDYAQAWLELGKTYYAQREYEPAITALGQIPRFLSGPVAREANFYLGLAAYAHGDFAKSESAFEFVAARLPLAEVYNNLGVVAARRGQKKGRRLFRARNSERSQRRRLSLQPGSDSCPGWRSRRRGPRAARGARSPPQRHRGQSLLDSFTPPAASGAIVPRARR